MSLSLYRPIASSSRTVLAPLVSTRTFASSSKSYAGAPKGAPSAEIQKRRAEEILLSKTQHQSDDIEYIGSYNRDEPTFLGFLRALEMQESWDLYDKVKKNDSILRAQTKPFRPPKSPIRISRTVDLTFANDRASKPRSALVPVSALPLKSSDAVHRIKLLAGTRWSPGKPGKEENEYSPNDGFNAGAQDIGKEGWIKLASRKFDDGRMNRKFVSDVLERLVEAANDPKSPLSKEIPIDTRHLIARRKKREHGGMSSALRIAAVERQPHTVGGVKGFPIEWLSDDRAAKLGRPQTGTVSSS